jgi:DNA-binding transcriptional ArsR family regulator
MKVFVLPYGSEEVTLLAHLASSRMPDGGSVIFLSPAGQERNKKVTATVSGFETVIDILNERGLSLRFKDVPVHISDFVGTTIDITNAMKQARPDDLIVDLSEGVPMLSLEIYAAAIVYASMVDATQRERIRVRCRPPGSDEGVNVFLPVFSVARFLPLVRALDRHPNAKLRELQQWLKKHPSTVSRQLMRAERAGLVHKANGKYMKTEFGSVVLKAFADSVQ